MCPPSREFEKHDLPPTPHLEEIGVGTAVPRRTITAVPLRESRRRGYGGESAKESGGV